MQAVPGGKRGTVFAYRAEIDDWLTRNAALPDLTNEASEAPVTPRLGDVAPVTLLTPVPETRLRPRWLRSRSAVVLTVVSGALLALILVNASTRRDDAGAVVRAELIGNELRALTAEGEVVFEIPSSDLIPTDSGSATVRTVMSESELVVEDFDGDGSADVLAVLGFITHSSAPRVVSDEVHYYSDTGRLRWKYRVQRRLRFGGREFDGPWRIFDRLVTRDADGRKRIFLAVVHDVWWPSFIVSLDAKGVERLHHVNAGHLYSLQHLQSAGRELLIATGVNNEYKSALLAAIDPGAPPTVSPQTQSAFICEECTGSPPPTYVLFPPTELSRLRGRPYNEGLSASVTASEVRVSIKEFDDPQGRSIYSLARSLDVQSFALSDAYWGLHQLLEQKGELGHPASLCPERSGRQIQAWTTEGWRQVWVRGESPSH